MYQSTLSVYITVALYLCGLCSLSAQHNNKQSAKAYADSLISEVYISIRADDFLRANTKNLTLRNTGIKKKDTYMIANSYSLGGIIYGATQKLDSSAESLKYALQLFKKIKDTQKLQTVKSNLSILSRKRNFTKDSIHKMIDIAQQMRKDGNYVYFSLQFEYIKSIFEFGDMPELLNATEEWLSEYKNYDFSTLQSSFSDHIIHRIKPACTAIKGYALIETQKYEEGYSILIPVEKELKAKHTDHQIKKELADYYFYRAKYFLEHKKNKDSLNYFLSKFFKNNNLAYRNFKTEYKESLTKLEDGKRELELLSLQNEKNKAIAAQYNWIALLAISAFLATLVLIIFVYRNNVYRKNIQLLLERKNKELISIDKDRNHFFSIVAHELRTPIYSVKGLVQMITEQEEVKHKKSKSHLNSLETLSNHLSLFVDNILQYAKFNLGETKLEGDKLELRVFLNKFIEPYNLHNHVTLHVDKEVYEYLLLDRIKMSQILINLIQNAIKFSNNGKIHITVTNIAQDDETNTIRFAVRDEGRGIPKDKLGTIFKAYSKNNSRIEYDEGTGLGLYIVNNIVALYNSKVNVVSEVGKGTEFSFILRLNKYTKIAEKQPNKNLTLAGFRILTVDDNKINLMITKRYIQNAKGECITVDNGYDAIELAQEQEFDVILMDIHMPGINGLEASKKIRSFDSKTPIIALTAVDFESMHQSISESGINAIVTKPFRIEDLTEKIYTLTNKTSITTKTEKI